MHSDLGAPVVASHRNYMATAGTDAVSGTRENKPPRRENKPPRPLPAATPNSAARRKAHRSQLTEDYTAAAAAASSTQTNKPHPLPAADDCDDCGGDVPFVSGEHGVLLLKMQQRVPAANAAHRRKLVENMDHVSAAPRLSQQALESMHKLDALRHTLPTKAVCVDMLLGSASSDWQALIRKMVQVKMRCECLLRIPAVTETGSLVEQLTGLFLSSAPSTPYNINEALDALFDEAGVQAFVGARQHMLDNVSRLHTQKKTEMAASCEVHWLGEMEDLKKASQQMRLKMQYATSLELVHNREFAALKSEHQKSVDKNCELLSRMEGIRMMLQSTRLELQEANSLGITRAQELLALDLARAAACAQAATHDSQMHRANKSRDQHARFATSVAHNLRQEHKIATGKLTQQLCDLENFFFANGGPATVGPQGADAAAAVELLAMQQHHKINIRKLSELQASVLSSRALLESTRCACKEAQARTTALEYQIHNTRAELAQQTAETNDAVARMRFSETELQTVQTELDHHKRILAQVQEDLELSNEDRDYTHAMLQELQIATGHMRP